MKIPPLHPPKTNATKGFSLVELLVSVVILSIGVLGTVALQARALNDNQDAYLRTQAIFLAYDMGDRINANPKGWVTVPSATNNSCTASNANCSVGNMAAFDYWNWQNDVTAKLTGGTGTVVLNGTLCSGTATAAGMRIMVTWTRVNTNAALGPGCYSLDIVPRT